MKQSIAILTVGALLGVPVGASEDKVAPLGTYKPSEKNYWAFQPRKNATPPAFSEPGDKAWVKTPVDAFILASLKKAGLKPAAPADKVTLIRRVTYDLHGLPPTPEEIDAAAEYSHRVWRTEDGLPQNRVQAIAQTGERINRGSSQQERETSAATILGLRKKSWPSQDRAENALIAGISSRWEYRSSVQDRTAMVRSGTQNTPTEIARNAANARWSGWGLNSEFGTA